MITLLRTIYLQSLYLLLTSSQQWSSTPPQIVLKLHSPLLYTLLFQRLLPQSLPVTKQIPPSDLSPLSSLWHQTQNWEVSFRQCLNENLETVNSLFPVVVTAYEFFIMALTVIISQPLKLFTNFLATYKCVVPSLYGVYS